MVLEKGVSMSYIKFKELSKYFDFKYQIEPKDLPDYAKEYVYYKKIHMFPYSSISTSAINFKPGKVELLFSFDSGYQLHVNFIDMNHDKKEVIKEVYKQMMNSKL